MHPAPPLIPLGCAIRLQNPPLRGRPKGGKQAGIKAIWEGNFTIRRHRVVGALLRAAMAHVVTDALCLPSFLVPCKWWALPWLR